MKKEVKVGVNFLKRLAVEGGKLDKAKGELFAEKLQKLLCHKYDGHWYPENPSRGQGYRCIRINRESPCDAMVLKACEESGLTFSNLGFPPEVTVWIDPLEVCARSGENCMPFTVESFSQEEDDETDTESLDTSDCHSTTSLDCCSTVSSNTEEYGQMKGEKKVEAFNKETMEGATCKITMVPRARSRPNGERVKANYVRKMIPVPADFQYVRCRAPGWPQYHNPSPVFLPHVYAPLAPPPPPQAVFGSYICQQPSPQFVIPRATRQPWGAVKS